MPGRRPEGPESRPEPVQSYADWKPDWLDDPELARPLTVESELVPEFADLAAEWLKRHQPASWGLEDQASWEPFQTRLIDLLFYEPRLTGPRWARLVARVLGVCAEMRMTRAASRLRLATSPDGPGLGREAGRPEGSVGEVNAYERERFERLREILLERVHARDQ